MPTPAAPHASNPERTYDLIVLGAGPAGLTASLYAARAGHRVLLLERFTPGGQAVTTWRVDNYPGVPRVNGAELVQKFEAQVREFKVSVVSSEALALVPGPLHRVDGADGSYWAPVVILTVGAAYRQLGIPGEDQLRGRGVSYCATCDGAFFKDMPVAVVGGGNTALEEAEFLTRFASKVYLIHRREHFRADKTIQDQVLAHPKVTVVTPYVPKEVLGADGVTALRIEHRTEHTCQDLDVRGVFIFVGACPNTDFLKDSLKLDEEGFIPTGPDFATAIPGCFAAGDCRSGSVKQIVVACGEGAAAAVHADRYLQTRKVSA